MSSTYQEYFENINTTYLFKYDGIREKRQFTIMIADKQDHSKIMRMDTDHPHDVYMDFLSKKGIDIPDCKIFCFFIKSKGMLVDYFGKETVFLFTMEKNDDVSFCVYINNQNYKASSLDAIKSFLLSLSS